MIISKKSVVLNGLLLPMVIVMLGSALIPIKAQVVLFSKQNFEGKSLNFETGDYADLNRILINSGFDLSAAPTNPSDPFRRRPPAPPALRVALVGSLRISKGYQATLCRLNPNNGENCRDFYHEIKDVSEFLPAREISIINSFSRLLVRRISWGVADLHTHPANHMGFGANADGNEGPFWGKPGRNPDGSTLATDLEKCPPDIHGGGTGNIVKWLADKAAINAMVQTTGQQHEASGWPEFKFWPDARSPIHQQMHIAWLQRAYYGGLRLIVASAGDNQLISDIWNRRVRLVVAVYRKRVDADRSERWELIKYVDQYKYERAHDYVHSGDPDKSRPVGEDYDLLIGALKDKVNYLIEPVGFEPGSSRDPNYDFNSARGQLNFIRQLAADNSNWLKVVRTPGEARAAISENKLAIVLSTEMDSLSPDQILLLRRDNDLRAVIPIHMANNRFFGGAAIYHDLFNSLNYYLNEDVTSPSTDLIGRFFRVTGDPTLSFRLSPPTSIGTNGLPFFGYTPVPGSADKRKGYLLGYSCCRDADGCSLSASDRMRLPSYCVPSNQGHRNNKETNIGNFHRLMSHGLLIDVVHSSHRAQTEVIDFAVSQRYPVLNSHTGLRDDGRSASDAMTGCFTVEANERAMTKVNAVKIRELGGVIGLGMAVDPPGKTILQHGGWPLTRFTTNERKTVEFKLPQAIPSGTVITRLKFKFRTGWDGLRGGDDNLYAAVILEESTGSERTSTEKRMNEGPWGDNPSTNSMTEVSWNTSEMFPGRTITVNEIKAIQLRTTFGGGLGGDNWNMDEVLVLAEDVTGQQHVLVQQIGSPAVRFRGNTSSVRFIVNNPVADPERQVSRLKFTIRTGEDGLGHNHLVHIGVKLCNNELKKWPIERKLNDHGNIYEKIIDLPAGTRLKQIIEAGVVSELDRDNWKIDEMKIEALIPETSPERSYIMKHVFGAPYYILRPENKDLMLDVARKPLLSEYERQPFRRMRINWTTGGDDLRRGSKAYIRLKLKTGEEIKRVFSDGAHWDNGTSGSVIVNFDRILSYKDIDSIFIDFEGFYRREVTDHDDNWDLSSLRIEILGDPIKAWASNYLTTILDLGGKGMALGSDINGLEKQIPYSEVAIDYTSGIKNGLDKAPDDVRDSGSIRSLGRYRMGNREYDVMNDGLAHYGLLPDLIAVAEAALSEVDPKLYRNLTASPTLIDPLFRSAEDFISMWEKVVEVPVNLQLRDRPKPVIRKLFLTIETGSQVLSEDSSLTAEIMYNDGSSGRLRLNSRNVDGRERGVAWPINSYRCGTIDVPGKRVDQIQRIIIRYRPGASRSPFRVASVRVDYDSEDLFVNSIVKRFTPHFEMTSESTAIEITPEQR